MGLTYGETIFRAGRDYNINPCFLAAKIRNEIGANGSDSVSGKNSAYPGIYNFYNIGATDGEGAIERGLQWASGNSTYSRPWTTPYKSIMGGAEFLAENYIAAGQFTGYLQRFNVNPDCDYRLYDHQYMTNLSGALSQGYSSYLSYEEKGLLNTKLVFSIPVYENMSDEEGGGSLSSPESTLQYGRIAIDRTRVRTGPSTSYSPKTASNGNTVWLNNGAVVKIVGKYRTDSSYSSDVLAYPYWYKINFSYSGGVYTGYVPYDFVEIATAICVTKGKTDIPLLKSDGVTNKIFYSDPTMVRVIDDNTVNFLKEGTVSLYIYDSAGKLDEVVFAVGDYSAYTPKNLSVTVTDGTAEVAFDAHSSATEYLFTVTDSNSRVVRSGTLAESKASIKGLKSGEAYTVYTQYCFGKAKLSRSISKTFVISPQKIEKLNYTVNADETVTLSWSAVENAEGYQLVAYNADTGKYEEVDSVAFGTNEYTLSAVQTRLENFCVRAYCYYQGKKVYGEVSGLVTVSDRPDMPKNIKVAAASTSDYRITWTGTDCDGYEVWEKKSGQSKYTLYKTTTETSVTVSGLAPASAAQYIIRSYKITPEGKLYSFSSSAITAITAPTAPAKLTSVSGSNRVLVSWSAVSGATSYNVYYKKDGGTLKLKSVGETSTIIDGLDGMSKYYFAVSAVVKKSNASTEGKKCATISATTLPSSPKGLTVVSVGSNYVGVRWKQDSTLDKYQLFLLDAKGTKIGSKVLDKNSLIVGPLEEGVDYRIIVRGYKLVDGKYISSENSETLVVSAKDASIKNLKADTLSDSAVISWDRVSGAAYYQIYQNINGNVELVATVPANQYKLSNLRECSTNYVAVRACFIGYNGDYHGAHSTLKFYTRPASVEKIVQSDRTDTSYTLTWEKSSSAVNRYYLYRYNTATKKFDLIGSTAKTSCSIKNQKPGTLQRYAVIAAVVKDGKALVSSKYTYYYTCGTYLSKVQNIRQTAATEKALRFTWDPVEGATSYRVYLYNTQTKAFVLLGETKTNVATLGNLSSGTQYIYRVQAVKRAGNVTFPGYYSSVLYAKTK